MSDTFLCGDHIACKARDGQLIDQDDYPTWMLRLASILKTMAVVGVACLDAGAECDVVQTHQSSAYV